MAEEKFEELTWKPVHTEHLVQDSWMDFRAVEYEMPDGTKFGPYYNYSCHSYVVIAASDEEGNFLTEKQYRHGIREITNEFPAGGIETVGGQKISLIPGKEIPVEDALAAAKRELLEETGYVSDEWTHLLSVPSNATKADNYAFLFRAKNCRKVGTQELDSTEFLQIEKKTPEEIDALIREGKFQQAIHVLAWLLVKTEKDC